MKKTTAMILLIVFVFSICVHIPISYAWLMDHDMEQNNLSIGENDVEIQEIFPENQVIPKKTAMKQVFFKNTGTIPCYIRAKYYLSTLEAEENLNIIFGSQLWKQNEDGYYYYQNVLAPGEITESFILGVEFKPSGALSKDFNLDVYTETIQAMSSNTAEEAFVNLQC